MGAVMDEEAVQALDAVGDRLEATGIAITNFVGNALAGLIEMFSGPTVDGATKAAQAVEQLVDKKRKVSGTE